jgi:ElaB/YqjD/DUF883 family membrane-anchored ribosome-binding protein
MSEQMTAANKEKLVSDLKVVISDTEELLRATAGAAGEKVGELRERLGVRLRDAKERVLDLEVARDRQDQGCRPCYRRFRA